MAKTVPCEQCPWRLNNQGKRHKHSFYTKKNLQRLWNQIRKGGGKQSCHLTDPSHPDHIAVGAKLGANTQECPGSVIIVMRELNRMGDEKGHINDRTLIRYFKERKQRGITKQGVRYWVLSRFAAGDTPFIGEGKLPDVRDDSEIGLPEELREG